MKLHKQPPVASYIPRAISMARTPSSKALRSVHKLFTWIIHAGDISSKQYSARISRNTQLLGRTRSCAENILRYNIEKVFIHIRARSRFAGVHFRLHFFFQKDNRGGRTERARAQKALVHQIQRREHWLLEKSNSAAGHSPECLSLPSPLSLSYISAAVNFEHYFWRLHLIFSQ